MPIILLKLIKLWTLFYNFKVIEELDEQMTITAGGKLERRGERDVRTVFPPQPPLPASASPNLSNITYTEVLSANDDFDYQNDKQDHALIHSDSDSCNNHRTPSTSSLLFVVEPVVSETAALKNNPERTPSINYDYETSRQTP